MECGNTSLEMVSFSPWQFTNISPGVKYGYSMHYVFIEPLIIKPAKS